MLKAYFQGRSFKQKVSSLFTDLEILLPDSRKRFSGATKAEGKQFHISVARHTFPILVVYFTLKSSTLFRRSLHPDKAVI